MIQRAGQGSHADLEVLCTQYWYPLYAYARHGGRTPEDAEDLTQSFVSKLIEKHWVEQASEQDCTFRSFLLIRFKRFLKDEREKGETQKRGGGATHVTIYLGEVEERYTAEPVDAGMTPDKLYDRAWATSVLDRVLDMLRKEFADSGKEREFVVLQPCLAWNENTLTYQQIAERIGRGEGWVKVAVNRMRKRYRKLLEQEVANTVPGSDIEQEMEDLHRALK
jgi:RNA polymerase sigma factor (sigma-70 family)